MCGIAGIFNANKSKEVLIQIGRDMCLDLKHRGPDGFGIEVLNYNQSKILLSHTRLSIIDLSDHASQPMSYSSENIWIVFNGEIYNFQDIKKELLKIGKTFKTKSDTEVILAAYSHWGLEAFNKFVGMWAIALWDKQKEEFILSRDRLGKKPLYFYKKSNGELFFASEPKAIIKYTGENLKLNSRAISDYFSYRYVLNNETFYENLNSVPAGSHIVFKLNSEKIIKYWDLPIVTNKKNPPEEEVKDNLRELLLSAVKYRMISDVPLGAFLSGGLDSSIIVALMSKMSRIPVKTYTIGFPEIGYNEFEYAKAVSDFYKTDHHEIELSVDNYLEFMDTMIKVKDCPLSVPNEIALHQLSKVLKKEISVVLSGEGADELFGGYGRIFRSAYDYLRWTDKNFIQNDTFKKNIQSKYGTQMFTTQIEHFLNQYSYMKFDQKNELFSNSFLSSLGADHHRYKFFENYWEKLNFLNMYDKYLWIFQKIHLEGLLGRLDSATMSASVEGRSPFVDHRLIEEINRLPIEYKMKWKSEHDIEIAKNLNSDQISETHDITKYILRKAYADQLPSIISTRKKVGFPVPLGQWLSGPLRTFAKEILSEPQSKTKEIFNKKYVEALLNDDSKNQSKGLQLWMIVNVELWMRNYGIN